MPRMIDPNPDPPPGSEPEGSAGPLRVPNDTTPTWELEMIVSGAVIFGLFRLPPLLDRSADILPPRFGGSAGQLLSVGLTLIEVVVFALIATFIIHLVSRTYWVALVGLDSVYPGGIRWDRLRRGPIFTEFARSSQRSLPARISAVDNFCSVIFAFAFLAVVVITFGVTMFAIATLIAIAISELFFGGRHLTELPTALIAIYAVALVILHRLDRRIGGRLPPDSRRARALRAGLVFFHRISGQALYGPILHTLTSNMRRRYTVPLLILGLLGLCAITVGLRRTIGTGGIVPGSYAYIPADATGQTVDARSYADKRLGETALSAVPFIQSDIISAPYVRLFIPYVADRDNPVLARCPGAKAPKGVAVPAPNVRAAATIRCLAALHAVEVDGRALPNLDFRFYTDPRSRLVGIVTYIPVADLPRGRNVLSLMPSAPLSGEQASTPVERLTIPFWL